VADQQPFEAGFFWQDVPLQASQLFLYPPALNPLTEPSLLDQPFTQRPAATVFGHEALAVKTNQLRTWEDLYKSKRSMPPTRPPDITDMLPQP
jgi:hypothetical protein